MGWREIVLVLLENEDSRIEAEQHAGRGHEDVLR